MDFWISEWISGFQIGFLDFTVDFWISQWISGFQLGFLDFWISVWISADGVRDFFRDGPLVSMSFQFVASFPICAVTKVGGGLGTKLCSFAHAQKPLTTW